MNERRRFSRIAFGSLASVEQGGIKQPGQVVDLSLHGLLINNIDTQQFTLDSDIAVHFMLDGSEIKISLDGQIVMKSECELHIAIKLIDLESMSHLKRLIELNIGDDSLLYREIEHLTNLHP